jgi:hypothetical protein
VMDLAGQIIKKIYPSLLSFQFTKFILAKDLYVYKQRKLKWKSTIEEKNGVKVFKNHKEPLYGEIEFELEEVFKHRQRE